MKQYILAGGFDYEFKGNDFNIYCTRRKDKIVAANPGVELKFIFFDFKGGSISSLEIKYDKGKKKETTTVINDTFDAIGSSNYVTGKFKNGQRNTLSVTHVYDTVAAIGNASAGTLEELSIFSHAWMGGPIFVNSYDDRSTVYTGTPGTTPPPSQIDITDPKKRDPDDKDGRSFDFSSPTMDVNKFKAAFSKNGFSWLWGCTATEIYKDMIHTIVKMPKYAGTATKDTDTFTFFLQTFLDQFDQYLGLKPTGKSKALTVTFADIKKLFCKVLQNTYAFELATASGKTVYSAFVGVGASFEAGSTGLMKADGTRTKVIDFYKTHLGIKIDPESRNYAEYLPALTCP